MPEILIIGRGFLGSLATDYFGRRAECIGSTEVDITSLDSVRKVLGERLPRVVLNAVAYTGTADLEKPENQAVGFSLNVQGPANLAIACQELDIRLVHVSTGMMFDGAGPGNDGWREQDRPEPHIYYAWTKALADWSLYPYLEANHILVLRMHLPLSGRHHPKNFLQKLQKFSKVVDVQSSVTVTEDFLTAMDQLLKQEAAGMYHVVNPGRISSYQIIELLKDEGVLQADKPVERIGWEELRVQVEKSGTAPQVFPILNTDKLQNAGIILPPIEKAIRVRIRQLKESIG